MLAALAFRLAAAVTCLVAPLAAAGCAAGPARWQSELGVTHPLSGQIWEVSGQQLITEEMLADRLADARFVLAGEQHDNADHHVLQGRIIRSLVARERRPAVVMEMLDVSDSDALHDCLESSRCSPSRLAKAVDWDHSGWPDWKLYEPVLDAALSEDLPVAPANLPVEEVHAFARTGELAAGEASMRRLGLDVALSETVREQMAADIRASHCGYAREEMIDGMVAAQRLRDAHMAESMLMAAPLGRAVLIAGLEHVRTDRAVAERLHAGGDRVFSVGLLEVSDDWQEPAAYAGRFATPQLPFDFVWFTPRVDDADPCQKFREQLERIGPPPQAGSPVGDPGSPVVEPKMSD